MLPVIENYAKECPDFNLFGMSYDEFHEDIFELIDHFEHGSNRIKTIVSSMKDFSRYTAKENMSWIDPKDIVSKAIAMTKGHLKKMVKSFEVHIQKDFPPILTSREALEHVIVNLLINTAQVTDKHNSWVKLHVALTGEKRDQLAIEVSDNGTGMDEETLKKIFDPFFTTKAPGAGTGLGLYICHSLVAELGGH